MAEAIPKVDVIEKKKAKLEKDYKTELEKRLDERVEAWKTMTEGETEVDYYAIEEEVREKFYGKKKEEVKEEKESETF